MGFLADLKEADLGISINISGLTDRAAELAREAGIVRHSVEYSLGFFGNLDRLPDRATLQLSTMCGHGMLSFGFARKMLDWVRTGRRAPEDCAEAMARFCSCGIFNTTRACRIPARRLSGPEAGWISSPFGRTRRGGNDELPGAAAPSRSPTIPSKGSSSNAPNAGANSRSWISTRSSSARRRGRKRTGVNEGRVPSFVIRPDEKS